jgi:high-affinity iron transporter
LLRKSKIFNLNPDEKFLALSRKGVFLIAAITFFRELLEATLFILRSAAQSPILLVGSSVLGLICAALIVYFVTAGISNINIELVFYILNLFLIGIGAYYFGDGLDVLFSNSVPEIFKIGVLCYAIPCYVIMIKKDLKKFINSDKINRV